MTYHRPEQPSRSTHEQAREIELKLAVPEGVADILAEHLRSQTSGQTQRRHEVTTYFDTPDGVLERNGMSLRVRRSDGRRVQTLKADRKAGVAADRGEWEWPVEQDQPDVRLMRGIPVAVPLTLDLKPVFTTEIDRTIRMLALESGTIVEAAFDEGIITAGDTGLPVRELELELHTGDAAALYRLALAIHAEVPLTVESESKAARGYRLRSGAHPVAHKADEVAFEPKAAAADALRQIVGSELGHLLANQAAALDGDAEGVHQMRVAIRRLRAALTLFQPHLEAHTATLFQKELWRVGRVFGEARDWDVFCLRILPEALGASDAAGWRDLLLHPAAEAREAAHRRFAEEVRSPAFTALVLGLAAWVEERHLLGGPALERPVADLCPPLLDRLADKVERRGHHIERRTDAERHALRKSLKKLRYGIDFLLPVFPRKSFKAYLHRCKKLQQRLGDINDAVAATKLAEHLGEGMRPELAPAIGALAAQLDRRRNDALHGLSKRWKAFRAEPRFWTS